MPKRTRYNRDRYDDYGYDQPRSYGRPPRDDDRGGNKKNPLNYTTAALFGGIFILGVAVGIGFSSSTSVNPQSIESRTEIDQKAPDAELCQQFGASAIVTDMRVFLTLSPFNVFVTQPQMVPGCVLRQNNWAILEQQNLINNEQVKDCKRRMNTFGYTGTLQGNPRINCIYQNDSAGNLFLESDIPKESDQF
jgi:hypothetical protein